MIGLSLHNKPGSYECVEDIKEGILISVGSRALKRRALWNVDALVGSLSNAPIVDHMQRKQLATSFVAKLFPSSGEVIRILDDDVKEPEGVAWATEQLFVSESLCIGVVHQFAGLDKKNHQPVSACLRLMM